MSLLHLPDHLVLSGGGKSFSSMFCVCQELIHDVITLLQQLQHMHAE